MLNKLFLFDFSKVGNLLLKNLNPFFFRFGFKLYSNKYAKTYYEIVYTRGGDYIFISIEDLIRDGQIQGIKHKFKWGIHIRIGQGEFKNQEYAWSSIGLDNPTSILFSSTFFFNGRSDIESVCDSIYRSFSGVNKQFLEEEYNEFELLRNKMIENVKAEMERTGLLTEELRGKISKYYMP